MTPALDALREGLFACDGNWRVTYVNRAVPGLLESASGCSPGDHCKALLGQDAWDRIESEGLPSLARAGHWQGTFARPGSDGDPLVLSLSALADGGFVGLVRPRDAGLERGEREHLHAEARGQRLAALRRLAGGLGHELNNVLASIQGYGRFLTEDLTQGSQSQGFAEQIVEASGRAKRLLDEALGFARPARGEMRAVPVAEAIERVTQQLRAVLPAAATIRVLEGRGDATVEATPEAFESALHHLLSNAAQALQGEAGVVEVAWRTVSELGDLPGLGRPGEPLQVTLQPSEAGGTLLACGRPDRTRPFLALVVRDSGAGIAPEALEHLFEPYFTTHGRSRARGLGLSLVFGQVIGHGGAIVIDSAPGRGTEATLYWPVAAPPGEAASPEALARRQLPRGRGQRILVAEDDQVLREALGEMLQRLGYRPVLVDDGELARRTLAEDDRVQAVLTDRRMPNLSGTELIAWMRAQGLGQPVLLYTGYGEDLDVTGFSPGGDVTLLSKPVDAATLARSLERLLTGDAA